jgi:hypothetical protein
VLISLFLILTLAIAAILWVGSVVLQGWLYNDLSPRLPIRALIGGLIMSAFLTGWCAIYKKDPGRFDTLQNFSREKLDGSYDEFQSIRKVGEKEKPAVKFTRVPGGRGTTEDFRSAEGRKAWARSDGDGMAVAILVQEKDKTEPTRFNAVLEKDGKFPASGLRYMEEKGNRYMDEHILGRIYRIRPFSLISNLFANGLHLALWIAVVCLIMRFALNHAVGIGLAIWAIVMVVAQPILFGLVTK